jgi:hypothetical protein
MNSTMTGKQSSSSHAIRSDLFIPITAKLQNTVARVPHLEAGALNGHQLQSDPHSGKGCEDNTIVIKRIDILTHLKHGKDWRAATL